MRRLEPELPIALSALHDMLISRKKKVSDARVMAFCKRLATVALQLGHPGAVGVTGLLRSMYNTHKCVGQLMDSQHEVMYICFRSETNLQIFF